MDQAEVTEEMVQDSNDSKLLLMVDNVLNDCSSIGETLVAVGERNSLGPNPLKKDELDEVIKKLAEKVSAA